jgi:hypothetical protein
MASYKKGGKWYSTPKGSTINITTGRGRSSVTSVTSPSPSSSSSGSSSKPSGALYYDIDDPTKQYERDGTRDGFKDSAVKVENPQSVQPRYTGGNSGGRIGTNITPGRADVNAYSQEAGVLTTTKDVAGPVAYWKVQSQTPSQTIEESTYMGNVRPINRNLNTKELYEYNKAQISYQQNAYNNPDKSPSQLKKEAIADAQQSFKGLSRTERAKLTATGFWVGGGGAVIGSAKEYFKAISVQKIGAEQKSTKLSNAVDEISSYPKGFNTWTSPSFYGKATAIGGTFALAGYSTFKNVQAYGVRGGLTETISSVAPVKIRPGTYVVQPPKNTDGYKVLNLGKNPQGQTQKLYSYNQPGYKVEGFEVGKGGFSSGVKFESAGAVRIQPGKTGFQQGNFLSGSTYQGSVFGGNTFKSGPSRTNINLAQVDVTGYTGGFTFPGSRPSTAIPKSTNVFGISGTTTGGAKTGFTSGVATNKGFGRFGLGSKGSISGVEYNLPKIFGSSTGGSGTSTGSGGVGTITKSIQTTTGVVGPSLKTTPPTSTFTTSPVVPALFSPSKPSQFTPTKSINQQAGLVQPKVEVTPKVDTKQYEGVFIDTIQKPKSSGRARSNFIAPVTSQLPDTTQEFIPITTPTTRQRPDQRQRQDEGLLIPSPSVPSGFNWLTRPTGPKPPTPLPPLPPMFAGGFGGLGSRPARARPSQTGYIPSFTALAFKITAPSRPKARATGFNFRPIIAPTKRRRKKKK